MKLDVLKPGAQKLQEFVKESLSNSVSINDYKKIDSNWTRKTMVRIANEYPEIFQIEGDKVSFVKKEKDLEAYKGVRSEVVKDLERFLVGPFTKDEELGSQRRPMQLYLTGKLVPFGSSSNVVKEEELDIQTNQLTKDENVDEYLSNRDIFRPSSLGLSFKLKRLCTVKIDASWGMYIGNSHKRTYHKESWDIHLTSNTKKVLENKNINSEPARVKYTVLERDGLFHVSIFLYNSYEREDTYPKQDEIMFQTKLNVSFGEENMAFFTSKADRFNVSDELLYRDSKELAIGHGVGVNWTVTDSKVQIESTWLPFHELPTVQHRTFEGYTFSMRELSRMKVDELRDCLSVIPTQYNLWLEQQVEVVRGLKPHLRKEAEQNIIKIKWIINRIEEGIDFITQSENGIGKKAFQFANRCMMIQRAQTKVAMEYRASGKRVKPIYDELRPVK